jgi:pSer/pThr/pTyr-binding forkhead associated (FHA) protein
VFFRKKKASVDTQAAPVLSIVEASPDSGETVGREFKLHRGDNYIGRDTHCEVVLRAATVSRRHANLRVGYGRATFTLVDLGSANGVLLLPDTVIKDGSREITNGASFRIGGIVLRLDTTTEDSVTETVHVSDMEPIR